MSKKSILIWLGLWLGTWGIASLLWGGDAMQASVPGIILLIFMGAIVLASILFNNERKIWLTRINSLQIGLIVGVIALYVLLDQRSIVYSLLTSGHVLFQQIMIAYLIFMTPTTQPGQLQPGLWRLVVLFALPHLLFLIFFFESWVLTFTILALIGSVLFTYIIQKIKLGLAWSYTLHLGFYFIFFNLV